MISKVEGTYFTVPNSTRSFSRELGHIRKNSHALVQLTRGLSKIDDLESAKLMIICKTMIFTSTPKTFKYIQ